MKAKISLFLTLVLAVSFVFLPGYGQKRAQVSPPASSNPSGRPAWEHTVIEIDNLTQGEKLLTELGAQGWELVTVQAAGNEMGGGFYYFKRPKL